MREDRQNGFWRSDTPVVHAFVTGSGRCGTLSVARYLDGCPTAVGQPVSARHESRFAQVVAALTAGSTDQLRCLFDGFSHDIEVSPLIVLFPASFLEERAVQYVGIVRDGRATVRSGYNKTWYLNEFALADHWTNVLAAPPGGRFEQCCHYWAWVYRRLQEQHATVLRLEDLRTNEASRRCLFAALGGISPSTRPFPHRHVGARSIWDAGRRGVSPLPAYSEWSTDCREIFTQCCGDVMDHWYPGWSLSW